jgi:hypothetical protein
VYGRVAGVTLADGQAIRFDLDCPVTAASVEAFVAAHRAGAAGRADMVTPAGTFSVDHAAVYAIGFGRSPR